MTSSHHIANTTEKRGAEHPKRILALSGGGVRGVIEVAFLEAIEASYRRSLGEHVRLCDLFHLVGGTSTGSLIAAAIALDLPLRDVRDFYLTRAAAFFRKDRWLSKLGHIPRFDGEALEREIVATVGDATLGDARLKTYLGIVTKRIDTGSPWILSNIPTAPYFNDPVDRSYLGNRHYNLAKILRAATAAPTYFDQKNIEIGPDQVGSFVDGGLSPHSDPSFALLFLARAKAYGLCWPTGVDALSILSLGTGRFRQKVGSRTAQRAGPLHLAYLALRGMVVDNEDHTVATMQLLGESVRPVTINSELGAMEDDCLWREPAFRYLRLDLPLDANELSDAGLDVSHRDVKRFQRFDDPDIIAPLYQLAKTYIAEQLDIDKLLSATRKGPSA